MNKDNKLVEFGQLYSQDHRATCLLDLQHYFILPLRFDPVTMQPLIMSLSQACNFTLALVENKQRQDRLTRLLDHCLPAIKRILAQPRTIIIREHEMVPVYKAQRIDSRSIEWLSRQPGRNVREKLAAQPHILALARKESYNTLENRLLKAMLIQLKDLLFLKQSFGVSDEQSQIIDLIEQNLLLPLFKAIKPWQHMPPNNVLTQDKQYRKIWDSWQAIQQLDEQLQSQQRGNNALLYFIFKETVSQLFANPQCHLIEQSWQCDFQHLSLLMAAEPDHYLVEGIIRNELEGYKSFKLRLLPEQSIELECDNQIYTVSFLKEGSLITCQLNGNETNRMSLDLNKVKIFVQIMLTDAFDYKRSYYTKVKPNQILEAELISIELGHCQPMFMLDKKNPLRLNSYIISDKAGLDCRYSRAFDISHDVASGVSLNQEKSDHVSAHLVEMLAKEIKPLKAMHYLVSDYHSDFATIHLRRDFNRYFNNSSPLPKSIAAVYDLLCNNKMQLKVNDLFFVLDNSGDALYVSPVIYKQEISKDKTKQLYFERHPALKIQGETEAKLLITILKGVYPDHPEQVIKKFIALFSYQDLSQSKFSFTIKEENKFYTVDHIKIKSSLGSIGMSFDSSELLSSRNNTPHGRLFYVPLSRTIHCPKTDVNSKEWCDKFNLVRGSQTLLEKKQNEPNGLFWKDHLPQLSTRLLKNGQEIPFFFVGDNVTIKPMRDKAVKINISDCFELPAGKDKIEFKVIQGKDKLKTIFLLTLQLKNKLKNPLNCKLELSYQYADAQPYQLRFIPIFDHASFSSITAEWGKPERKEISIKSYFPDFPKSQTIAQLRKAPKKGSASETSDIIDWMIRNLDEVLAYKDFYTTGNNRKRITINSAAIDWIPNKDFGFERNHLNNNAIFIHKSDLYPNFVPGEMISGNLLKKNDKYSLKDITKSGQLSDQELKGLQKRWRFPLMRFNDYARDYHHCELSHDDINKINQALDAADYLVQHHKISTLLSAEIFMLAAYFHQNLPRYFIDRFLTDIKDKNRFKSQYLLFSYVLGNVSTPWQKTLLNKILELSNDEQVKEKTLEALSIALWRHPDVIHKLSFEQIENLVKCLTESFSDDIRNSKKNMHDSKWVSILRRLELMLAIIRCRGSQSLKIKESLELFSPLSELMRNCWLSINDNLGSKLHQKMQGSESKINSRVKLAVDKPEGYKNTPEILYALKLYLTGENGANQISITELIDSN